MLGKFQEFVFKVAACNPLVKFLPWFYDGEEVKPEIDSINTPFKSITGTVWLKDYLGSYNCTKGILYGRVKVQAQLDFQSVKNKMVDWIRQDLHWMKEDYIQARRISTIGLLAYTYGVVDRLQTRQALEHAVSNEIQREVKLDLWLRRVACKKCKR